MQPAEDPQPPGGPAPAQAPPPWGRPPSGQAEWGSPSVPGPQPPAGPPFSGQPQPGPPQWGSPSVPGPRSPEGQPQGSPVQPGPPQSGSPSAPAPQPPAGPPLWGQPQWGSPGSAPQPPAGPPQWSSVTPSGPQPQWESPSAWGPPPQQPAAPPPRRPARLRSFAVVTSLLLVAVAGLAVAVVGGLRARAELTRPPTAAERSQAAVAAVAARWQRWPTGKIFPASLSYTTSLLTQETADRIGIAPGYACSAALVGRVATAATGDGCRAAVRATYADQLQGVLVTAGVLAFPTPAKAAAFMRATAADRLPAGLRALSFPRTASARFNDAARQVVTERQAGPYVVITVAGYADGRPASAARGRPSVFAPARQLASDILTPLAQPAAVNCANPEWAC
jgi:hypothetical protein